jgi:hypothetical protein
MSREFDRWQMRQSERRTRGELEPPGPQPETPRQRAWREFGEAREKLAEAKAQLKATGDQPPGMLGRLLHRPDPLAIEALENEVDRLDGLVRVLGERALDSQGAPSLGGDHRDAYGAARTWSYNDATPTSRYPT